MLVESICTIAGIGIGTALGYFLFKTKPKLADITKTAISQKLEGSISYQAHLSNVISGINHEVSPWFGKVVNIVSKILRKKTVDEDNYKKLEMVMYSMEQATLVLRTISSNVKVLQGYSNIEAPLIQTVRSWVNVTLMDRFIKDLIHEDNILVDERTLGFTAKHSPMLLSQIILNLAKNSVEHNSHMLESLRISFWGIPDKKILVIEDNGSGIDSDVKSNIFKPGISTKDNVDKKQHGLGLSICLDYAISMNAAIWFESSPGQGTRFYLQFEQDESEMCKTGAYQVYLENTKFKDGCEETRLFQN